MKWLMRYSYLIMLVASVVVTDTYSSQKKMTVFLQGKEEEEQLFSGQKQPKVTSEINPIMCDENDEEMCQYIEQEYKESRLKLWFYDLGIIVMIKLISLKEYLDKCKGAVDGLVKRLFCPLCRKSVK